jgi:glyoxylase-like metal-dependent hydrolase (beta-lactamase superfamily II)
MSHSHGDHAGNANLFGSSVLLMQSSEYAAVFGPEPQKYNFVPANFEKLRNSQAEQLNGDRDVFGDGAVIIKATPGHTPGHQSLFVRLPRHAPVLLSGDMVHLRYSWDNRVVPGFNFDVAASGRSIDAMKEFVRQTGAQIWITHDMEQHRLIPKSPLFVE